MTKAPLTHPEQTQHGAFWRIEIDGMSVGGQASYSNEKLVGAISEKLCTHYATVKIPNSAVHARFRMGKTAQG